MPGMPAIDCALPEAPGLLAAVAAARSVAFLVLSASAHSTAAKTAKRTTITPPRRKSTHARPLGLVRFGSPSGNVGEWEICVCVLMGTPSFSLCPVIGTKASDHLPGRPHFRCGL